MKREYDLKGLYKISMGLILFVPAELVSFFNTGLLFSLAIQGTLLIATGFIFFGLYSLFNYSKSFSVARNAAILLSIAILLNAVPLFMKSYANAISLMAVVLSGIILILQGTVTIFIVKGCEDIAKENGNKEQENLCKRWWKIYLYGFIGIFLITWGGIFLISTMASFGLVTIIIAGALGVGINLAMVARILETYKAFNASERISTGE